MMEENWEAGMSRSAGGSAIVKYDGRGGGEAIAGGGGGGRACAACKYQRRRCTAECPLAAYFPAERAEQFRRVRRLFGVCNVLRILKRVKEPALQEAAMMSVVLEAEARHLDPVHGSLGLISALISHHRHLRQRLRLLRHTISLLHHHHSSISHPHIPADPSSPAAAAHHPLVHHHHVFPAASVDGESPAAATTNLDRFNICNQYDIDQSSAPPATPTIPNYYENWMTDVEIVPNSIPAPHDHLGIVPLSPPDMSGDDGNPTACASSQASSVHGEFMSSTNLRDLSEYLHSTSYAFVADMDCGSNNNRMK